MSTSDSNFLKLNRAALLAFGLNPDHNVTLFLGDDGTESDLYWTPESLDAKNLGVEIPEGTVSLQLSIAMQQRAGAKSYFVLLDEGDFNGARTYTVTINGTPYTTTGEADAEAALESLETDINADHAADTDPSAVLYPQAYDGKRILHVWAWPSTASGTPTLTLNTTSDVGTGSTAILSGCDLTDLPVQIWVKDRGPTGGIWPDQWYVPPGGEFSLGKNYTQRLDVSGYSRLAVRINGSPTKVTGAGANVMCMALIRIAPCLEG